MKNEKGFSLIFVLLIFGLMVAFGVYVYSLILQAYKKTYDNTKYDAKVIIQKNTSGSNDKAGILEVRDKNKNLIASIENNKSEPHVLLKNEKYNIEIINSKDDKINLNFKDSSNSLIDSWQITDKMNYSDRTVILEMDADAEVDLNVRGINEINDNTLYIFFTKIKSSIDTNDSIKYSFKNEGGTIQTYSNVYKKIGK